MTLVASDGTAGWTNRNTGPSTAHPWWAPRWLRRQREEREMERWAAELGWQWAEVMEGAQLTRHTVTAAQIPLTITPQVHSVDPGPPVTLLVEMLPGQVVEDFEAQTNRIAESMGVSGVHITPYDPGWIKVTLVE
jgi:hypothetical protein